jgi:hypothetical protein
MIGAGEVFTFLILVLAGLVVGSWLGERFGCFGFLVGLPLGAAAMLGILYVGALSWDYAVRLILREEPWLPTCRQRKCKGGRPPDSGDYAWVKVNGDLWGFRCRCGDTYRKVGRRFVELAPDGTFRPYLICKPLRGWCADQEAQGR